MRKRYLSALLGLALAAAAMAGAVTAPAEVLENLEFFSDFELLFNLEILEDEAENGRVISVSTAPAISTASAVAVSSYTVAVSTAARRSYEKR